MRSELLLCCSRPPAPRSRAVSPGPDAPQGAEAKRSVGGSGAESKPRIRRFVPDIQEIRVRYVHDTYVLCLLKLIWITSTLTLAQWTDEMLSILLLTDTLSQQQNVESRSTSNQTRKTSLYL